MATQPEGVRGGEHGDWEWPLSKTGFRLAARFAKLHMGQAQPGSASQPPVCALTLGLQP